MKPDPLIQHDYIVVVDIEATCWDTPLPPSGQQNEIIEIGVCVLDVSTAELARKRSLLVKPQHSTVSPFCTQLTSLTQQQVDTGMTFDAACALLEEDYATKTHVWGSWGSYDRKIFQVQCAGFGVPYPFSEHYINIKWLFNKLNKKHKQGGVAHAMTFAELTFEGTPHRGHDDAWNIARLLAFLQHERGPAIFKKFW